MLNVVLRFSRRIGNWLRLKINLVSLRLSRGLVFSSSRVKLEKPDTTGWLCFIDSGDRDQMVEFKSWLGHQLFREDGTKHNQLEIGFYPVLRT